MGNEGRICLATIALEKYSRTTDIYQYTYYIHLPCQWYCYACLWSSPRDKRPWGPTRSTSNVIGMEESLHEDAYLYRFPYLRK